MSDHFFSRWSRRKQGIENPEVTEAQPLAAGPGAGVAALTSSSGALGASKLAASSAERVPAVAPKAGPPEPEPASPPDRPLPTMDDVQGLTPSSDYQGFMRQGVPGEVRNAAMKKLFTDPHFNVMDGLDIYIGDYNTPDPLPAGMLEKMVGAQLLHLFPPQADERPSGQAEQALGAAPPRPEQGPPPSGERAATAPVASPLPPSAASDALSSMPDASSAPSSAPSSLPSSPLATPLAPLMGPPRT